MKFLADMGISPRVVEELRQKGHDAVHLAEQGLHRMVDGDILQKARQENRVLLTHDLDFGEFAECNHLSSKRHARCKC
jgi:predicted nuclease of predicted toxin-antitoxin system